jgi:hypothetical protein
MATAAVKRSRTKPEAVIDEHRQALAAAVSAMSDEMVECRDIQHSYRKWSLRWVPKDKEYESKLKCIRCGSIRVRRINGSTGALVSSSYEYAEGYLVKGLGRLTGSDRGFIRLQSMLADVTDAQEVARNA